MTDLQLVPRTDETYFDSTYWVGLLEDHLQRIVDADPLRRQLLVAQIPDLLHVLRLNRAAHRLECGA